MRKHLAEVLGLALVAVGIGMWSIAASLVFTGAVIVALAERD